MRLEEAGAMARSSWSSRRSWQCLGVAQTQAAGPSRLECSTRVATLSSATPPASMWLISEACSSRRLCCGATPIVRQAVRGAVSCRRSTVCRVQKAHRNPSEQRADRDRFEKARSAQLPLELRPACVATDDESAVELQVVFRLQRALAQAPCKLPAGRAQRSAEQYELQEGRTTSTPSSSTGPSAWGNRWRRRRRAAA
jgi:hypothetical protein